MLTVATAGYVLFSTDVKRTLFVLQFTIMGASGLFLLLNAEYLSVVYIIVFIGIINLLRYYLVEADNEHLMNYSVRYFPLASFTIILFLAVVSGTLISSRWNESNSFSHETTIAGIGNVLMNIYFLPFEIVSLFVFIILFGELSNAKNKQ